MRLVINPGTSQAREVDLQRGTNRFGRSPGNDFTIDDPSVSSFHATIEVGDDSAVIKDLGSTNGTLIHGIKVQEILLQPGETFRVGSVEMVLQADRPEREAVAAVETMRAGASPGHQTVTQLCPEPQVEEPVNPVSQGETTTASTDKPIF